MKNDLTGKRFGLLTVIGVGEDYVSPSGKHRKRWLCQCDCGNIKSIQPGALIYGKARSCGCQQKKLASENAKKYAYKRALDITGERFGKLTAIECVGHVEKSGYLWRCKCDCGNETVQLVKCLRSGNVKSCGCLRDEKIALVNMKHGKSHKSRLYHVWTGMRDRCNNPNNTHFNSYGGRGICVCEEWNDFPTFEAWAMASGYDPDAAYGDCTIDRIDVNGNYEPSNCRWITLKEQFKNTQRTGNVGKNSGRKSVAAQQ